MITEILGWVFGGAFALVVLFYGDQYHLAMLYEKEVREILLASGCPAYNSEIVLDFRDAGASPVDAAHAVECWWGRVK